MLNKDTHLNPHIFSDDIERAPTRDGFGRGAVEAGKENENVVVVCADLADSTRAQWFKDEFPKRYIEIGVAEQNLATVASGLSAVGKIPFITSYAAFNPGRNYEQIRTTIALNNRPVKVCGMHAGVSVGPDGATHQMLEDIGLMRMLPHMVVVVPADAEEARKATFEASKNDRPTYLRFGREKTPTMTTAETPFEIGKAYYMWSDPNKTPDATIIGIGSLLYGALEAAHTLSKEGIAVDVINSHTVKPLDVETIVEAGKRSGAIVTVEEHQAHGGFGSLVAETMATHHPLPIEMVAVQDKFGQSGSPEELLKHYQLDKDAIVSAVRKVVKRK
ncbi:transketolase [Candidatus Kaiserbacteria bacterium CG10_big_fil_rev_8_21_14_0_10_45_20]|uniref:Transketolase n=1 Tax=Candidatus Kaiserbacteria bacterium CG10_big_fil_rev_8_21_14_0_10_45_20 TaxID=1974607 RepID=A0A2H0UGY7_9BACT|nr:MAG: transketolase [Candidatus Kaiserbacteria bacterium CG10_big_fil_rev_8_21_14_0_10_45_20]